MLLLLLLLGLGLSVVAYSCDREELAARTGARGFWRGERAAGEETEGGSGGVGAEVTPCAFTNTSTVGIAGEIGEFVDVVRLHLDFTRKARKRFSAGGRASSSSSSSSAASDSSPTGLAAIIRRDVLAEEGSNPPLDMLENLICSLRAHAPTKPIGRHSIAHIGVPFRRQAASRLLRRCRYSRNDADGRVR